ncbi:MAG: hypothetical protein J6Q65_00200 [Lentisphaeria bacterium]|nr:hypothetical protein [Lentisphaeria bacterium]
MKIAAFGNWHWSRETEPDTLLPWFTGGTVNGGKLVKQNARRSVYRVTAADGATYYAKLEHGSFLLFRNKAVIEYRAGKRLQNAGIPCVEFTACGRLGLTHTILVSRAVENTCDSREYFFTASPEKRAAFLDALIALQKKMRKNGIRHRDFHAGNLLVREREDGTCDLILVDPLEVRQTGDADPFELARILSDYCPVLSDEDALRLAENDPELLQKIREHQYKKCCHEWGKRKKQILSGNSKFSRTHRRNDGRVFEVASTPWYRDGILPDDPDRFPCDICPAKEGERRWLEMFRARLEGRGTEYDYQLREICSDGNVRLYRCR